jgi:hypothetical protein
MSDNDFVMTEELYYMIKARDSISKIPKDERNVKVQIIYNDIQNYIFQNCSHTFINDYIDYTPEKSGSITYCCKCLLSHDFMPIKN